MDFKTQSHIFIHHFKLVYFFYLHLIIIFNFLWQIRNFKKWISCLKIKTILRIRKKYPYCFFENLDWIWLNQSNIWIMRFRNRCRNFSFLFFKHELSYFFRIILFKLFLIFFQFIIPLQLILYDNSIWFDNWILLSLWNGNSWP